MSLYTLAPQPWLVFLDDAGLYIPNGQLAIYQAGTSTPATVYTSASGTAHPFPITLDGAGRVPGGLYLQPGLSYKFVLHAPLIEEPLDGAIIKSQDNIETVPRSGGSVLRLLNPGDYSDLNVGGVDIIEYVGAGDVTIRGMVGGVLGQSILIRNLTQYTIWLINLEGAAPAGAKLLNLIDLGPMVLAATRSLAHYTYLSSGVWGMDAYEMGRPVPQAFDAANYSGALGMTWTVDMSDPVYENFYLVGRLLLFDFNYQNTSIGGTPSQQLMRRLPFQWQSLTINHISGTIWTNDAGATVWKTGIVSLFDAEHFEFLRAPVGELWEASVNTTTIIGQIQIVLR